MQELEIFKATRDNFTDIKKLMLSALAEDPLGFSSSFEEYNNNSEYWWMSYLEPYISGDRDIMFLAKKDQMIVGMSGLLFNKQERKSHIALIAWVYILKNYRRLGFASMLINKVLEEAKSRKNIEKVTLYVNDSQKEALKLYKKFGFKASGKLVKDLKIDGKYFDTFIMELFLDSTN